MYDKNSYFDDREAWTIYITPAPVLFLKSLTPALSFIILFPKQCTFFPNVAFFEESSNWGEQKKKTDLSNTLRRNIFEVNRKQHFSN